jgi:hypothetical protein
MTVTLDHLAYAVPDLAAAVVEFESRTGIRPVPGGSHAGRGTANYLVGLGTAYLEIIGPDPGQPDHDGARPFGVSSDVGTRLATWAVRTADLETVVADARHGGYDPGDVVTMSRKTPTGALLQWRLTVADPPAYDGLVPFLIDWGTTTHPASTDLPQAELATFTATHPRPDEVRHALALLGADLLVEPAPEAALHAVLRTPRGAVAL